MSNAKKKSFILFNDLKGTIDDLDDAEAANLLRAIFEYQQEGNVDSFDKLTKLLMPRPIMPCGCNRVSPKITGWIP